MTIPAITVEQAGLSYNNSIIFDELSLHLPAGEWVALLGPSGIGKSSLLKLIAGLIPTQSTLSGHIKTTNNLPAANQAAYMAQSDLLLPWLNVLDNACLGTRLSGSYQHSQHAYQTKAASLLTQVGLENTLHLYPHQLSGGMRQRVALVRTLMQEKPIILMDEPFSALDAITRHQMQALAARMLKGKTVLFITHDPSEAIRLANHIYIMQGRPATLKYISHLTSQTPRDICNEEANILQSQLLTALTTAAGDIS